MQTSKQAETARAKSQPKSQSSQPPVLFGIDGGADSVSHHALVLFCTPNGLLLPLNEKREISVFDSRISTEIRHYEPKNGEIALNREIRHLVRDTTFSHQAYPGQSEKPGHMVYADLDEDHHATRVFHVLVIRCEVTEHEGFVCVPYEQVVFNRRFADGTTLEVLNSVLESEDYIDAPNPSKLRADIKSVHDELKQLSDERETFVVATCRGGILFGHDRNNGELIWTLRHRHLHQCMPGVTEAVAERLLRKLGGYEMRKLVGTFVIDNKFVDIYVAELTTSTVPFERELRIFSNIEVKEMLASEGSIKFDKITKKVLEKI